MIFALTLSFKASSSNGITTLMPFSSLRDHPRGCGAHGTSFHLPTFMSGSSPRVRGSLNQLDFLDNQFGIIPAGAGLTIPTPSLENPLRDHPRGCGAHQTCRTSHLGPMGSSPRVRGSPRWRCGPVTLPGIIPAGAGLTLSSIAATDSTRDHPRGCGAHFIQKVEKDTGAGSSPRVRGSRIVFDARPGTAGIIPAGAGLTCQLPCRMSLHRDHPRGCGAHP